VASIDTVTDLGQAKYNPVHPATEPWRVTMSRRRQAPDKPAATAADPPDDIRGAPEALDAPEMSAAVTGDEPTVPPPAPATPDEPAAQQPSMPPRAAHFRPTLRAPVALLTVFDDGESDGEVIRIRGESFVIGRTEGDFLLPQDGLVSARHIAIVRERSGDAWRWIVTDLQTTDGLFIRVSRTDLADGAEFLVGRGRYRFEGPLAQQPETPGKRPDGAGTTRPRSADSPRPPALVEMLAGEDADRFPLLAAGCWIGSDPACSICRADDPFAEPRHVQLSRKSDGAWEARNNKTANGLWLRVDQVAVDGACLFQIGEQRFRLAVGI
jgi:hypothetical protein